MTRSSLTSRCLTAATAVACAAVIVAQPADLGLPPSRPSASQPFPHRAARPYPVAASAVPADVRQVLAATPSRTVERGGQRWRVDPLALVRLEPDPMRLGTPEGLPLGGLRAIAIASDGAVWAGGPGGVVRFTGAGHPWQRWHVFSGRRFLPDDEVLALAAGDGGAVWVSTAAGVSHLRSVPMSLAEKAAHVERVIAERHTRHGLVADSTLAEPGDLTTSHQYPNDNDGLWTSIYAASQLYRHAVTRDQAALARAEQSLEALARLESVTGHPGFPARSFRHRTEPRRPEGEWHWTADGEWEWKGDTSSDELVGHFYAFAVAHRLLPEGETKARLRQSATRIADHLIRHTYNLVDLDGLPTRWGRWALDYFETAEGQEEQALRSTQLLSFMLVAAEFTGEPRFRAEYHRLIDHHQFNERMQSYLANRLELNFSDEQLAMLSFAPLFMFERDERRLADYRRALAQWWQNMQREDNPLWIYLHAIAHPGRPAELDRAAHTLVRMPIDLVKWTVPNAHRLDVPVAPEKDRFGRAETTRLLPPDERGVHKWNANPFDLETARAGQGEEDGAAFLLPFWLGRHHGFILE
jgi:hypothetical protein